MLRKKYFCNIIFGEREVMFQDTKGYTLIELTVVIILIGLLMTLVVPRFQYSLLTDDLKAATRRMVGTIREVRNDAIREQKTHYLHFDLESNRFWVDTLSMTEEERTMARGNATALPQTVRIQDVWIRGEGKKMTGEALIRFNKKGYLQQSLIHVGSVDGRQFTLVLRPFLGKVKVLEDYVEFEDY
jgi:prepilin-type N-terminal cleavage/methylation domain-containing protein